MRILKNFARQGWTFAVLVLAAVALFYLAYSLSGANIGALMAAGVVFGCLLTLFIAARQSRKPPAPRISTTLVTPTVLVSEIRAAALVSLGQIGTVTIKKERDKTTAAESMISGLHNRMLGEELVMDVGVRIVAGVNLKHLGEDDVRIDGNSVSITLPPTKVLMVYVDESLTRVVERKKGWLSSHDISLMDAARREAMDAMVTAAIDKGLFQRAGQQAAATVAALARGLGVENISVSATLPPIGQHFEELQDPELIAKLRALPDVVLPREDQFDT
ncbi:MAG TPA: DUF4230 domain-containing protein [Thermoflexales bacterium]|jgi:hypothetical protein|nr:DUF4230 domain-containing protein [Anaerolineae bacterium]HQX12108.1 DUF4230 domain-containing protein [Thermoflexales bacterium]HQY26036.1 DUF4230 domain-containing protein [Thermoflexales bacterium]